MKRYKRIRIIGGVLLVLGAAMIILALVEGERSVLRSLGAGGWAIGLGGALFGISLRLENKQKASVDPSGTPES